MSSVSSLSRLAVAIALGVSMQAAQAEEEAKELGTVTEIGRASCRERVCLYV